MYVCCTHACGTEARQYHDQMYADSKYLLLPSKLYVWYASYLARHYTILCSGANQQKYQTLVPTNNRPRQYIGIASISCNTDVNTTLR